MDLSYRKLTLRPRIVIHLVTISGRAVGEKLSIEYKCPGSRIYWIPWTSEITVVSSKMTLFAFAANEDTRLNAKKNTNLKIVALPVDIVFSQYRPAISHWVVYKVPSNPKVHKQQKRSQQSRHKTGYLEKYVFKPALTKPDNYLSSTLKGHCLSMRRVVTLYL